MTTDNKTLADVQPGGRVRLGDQRSDLVPGIVRCAKCQFQLVRSNLNMHDGTVTAGDSKTEPCPNGCGPLWPVTWETWAREGWAEAERLHLENSALSAQPSPGGQGEALASLPLYRLADDANGNRGLHRDDTGSWVKLQDIERALASRQPVEFERAIPTRRRESAVELLLQLGFVWNNQRWEDRRQPVGEPVFRDHPTHNVYRGSCGNLPCHCWADEDHIIGDEVKRYAAPPAQAVDHEVTDAMVDKAWNRFEAALHADDGDTPEDRVLSETIDQRDRYHEMADELAGHIARIIGVDIGEHSSANCPWQNAIEAAEVYQPAQAVDLGQEVAIADLRATLVRISESQPGDNPAGLARDALALIDGKAVGNK